MVLHPTLMASKFGRVHRHQPRAPNPPGDRLGRPRDKPVVRVHEVELVLISQFERELAHVGVHRADPADESVHILRELGLADPVHDHPVALVLGRQATAATGQHVHLDPVGDEVL